VTKQLRRQVRVATADDPQAHEEGLHEVRKASKRLRYPAEVAKTVPVGKRSAGVIPAAKKLQTVLGTRQDTVLTPEQSRLLGVQAFAAGENAWTYGRLHALEEVRATQAEQQFQDLWPSLHRMLRRATRRL
jgi:CHAD domain-containing protein